MTKKNCWEFMGCGRHPGGDRVKELGICPVVTETRLHCAHGGTNAAGHAGLWQAHYVEERYREPLQRNLRPVKCAISTRLLEKRKVQILKSHLPC